MGIQLRALLKPLNTIEYCDVRGMSEAPQFCPHDVERRQFLGRAIRLIGIAFLPSEVMHLEFRSALNWTPCSEVDWYDGWYVDLYAYITHHITQLWSMELSLMHFGISSCLPMHLPLGLQVKLSYNTDKKLVTVRQNYTLLLYSFLCTRYLKKLIKFKIWNKDQKLRTLLTCEIHCCLFKKLQVPECVFALKTYIDLE